MARAGMMHYWMINRKIFYGFLVIGLFIFLISLFHLGKSKEAVAVQLIYNFSISFGIMISLYLVLFFVSFLQFRKLRRIFSSYPFDSLPAEVYQIRETAANLPFFLASLTVRGESNDYPVRIEYEKGKVILVIGAAASTGSFQSMPGMQGLTTSDLGVIKTLEMASLKTKKDSYKLSEEIEKITSFLSRNGLGK